LHLPPTTPGRGRIASMRKEAVKRDLDPDKWFNNVEIVTTEKVRSETTTYVRNIFKYYTAYTLMGTSGWAVLSNFAEQNQS
jgi:membrane-bound lytic murein transglycosylase MltF